MTFKERWFEVAKEHLADNSIDSYWFWTKRFWKFTGCLPASQWEAVHVERFCRWLIAENYARDSRKQAFCAVIFAFKKVLDVELGKLDLPPLPPQRRPNKVIPTREELIRLFTGMAWQDRLRCLLMYGSGPRVEESCRIRVQDVQTHFGQKGTEKLR